MRINHNVASLNTYRMLSTNSTNGNKALEKLSSGMRINRAGDDAAGLAISEKMRAQIRGLDQAASNAQDGISLIQTAEGGLNEVHSILQRMRELADQSANGTNTADDRKSIQDEVSQLKKEIDRIGDTTEYNTQKLLNGDLKNASGISVGTNQTAGAVVGKLTAGVLADLTTTTPTLMSTADATLATTDYVAETINIDGTDITVNWQNLTTDEKTVLQNVGSDAASQQKAVDLMVSKINGAIDESGAGVAHVSGYVTSNGTLAIQSGSTGVNSKVVDTATDGVVANFMGGNATIGVGQDVYNGQSIAPNTIADMTVNGVLISVNFGAATIANGTDMSTVATTLQTDINNSITAYNATTGKTTGQTGFIEAVTVTVSDDGRFVINSQSGPATFANRPGQTVISDLGLTDAQTNSSSGGGMTFQIGANKGQSISFGISDMRTAALGISGIDVSTAAGASNALTALDKAIQTVSSERSKLGAVQNRLEHTINNLNTSSENLTSAESRIRDVDMAKEMMEYTKNNILTQAAQAMLAQANQQPQQVLQLLK